MIIKNEIFDRIRKINWFSNCGNYTDRMRKGIEIKAIYSWEEANYYYSQPIWSDATLQARNEF